LTFCFVLLFPAPEPVFLAKQLTYHIRIYYSLSNAVNLELSS
jgi:hypothetical protein